MTNDPHESKLAIVFDKFILGQGLGPRGARIRATVIVSLIVIGWLVGILGDLPTAILTAAEHGPEILRHPNFWWSITALIVLVITLCWIWRDLDSSATDKNFVGEVQILNSIARVLKVASAISKDGSGVYILTFIKNEFKNSIPAMIETTLGEPERKKFSDIMDEAEKNSNGDAMTIMTTGCNYLFGILSMRLSAKGITFQELLADSADGPR